MTLRKEERDDMQGLDEDAPQTIAAAQARYHKNNNPVHIHQGTKYANPGEANTQLDEGKMRIKALI